MPDLPALFQKALAHHQAGQLQQASSLYDSILHHAPTHAETLYLRGLAAMQSGDHSLAASRLVQATTQQPTRAVYWVPLGQVYIALDEFDKAKRSFDKALALDPNLAGAQAGLGDIALRERQPAAAQYHYQQSLKRDATLPHVWSNLSQAQILLHEFGLAYESAERALAIDPGSREALFNRAVSARGIGNESQSEQDYRTLLARDPCFVPARINLANRLIASARSAEALALYREGVDLVPNSTELRFAYASSLHESGDLSAAMAEYQHLLQQSPDHRQANQNLATALRRSGAWDEAIRLMEGLIARDPNEPATWIQLGHAHLERDDDRSARSALDRARACRPGDWTGRIRVARCSPLLFRTQGDILAYRQMLEQTLREALSHPRPIADLDSMLPGLEPSFHWPFHGMNDRPIKELYSQLFEEVDWRGSLSPQVRSGKPRVGIVVTDGHEPVFLRSMAGMIDRLICREFSLTMVASPRGVRRIRERLQSDDVDFVELPERFSLAQSAVARSNFDLIFYWEIGTDFMNYFLPMAKLAPVQVVSWGVPITTGHRAVDDYLSSQWLEPTDGDGDYTENLLRFRKLLSYQHRRPPVASVSREEFGLRQADHVYVCAQNLGKYHPCFVETIRDVLEQDPAGRLVVTSSRHPRPQEEFQQILADAMGPNVDRVLILPPLDQTRYHQLLGVADVQLDPFPFSGANSSYDAFSYDLPIVTLEGLYQRGRFTSGCYRAMGLEEWVAQAPARYVEQAVAWGTDPDRRRHAVELLQERTPVLFEDVETVREWEEYVCERIRSLD
ncbi:tetratricopeptide repeat protein [bacterium]|nr:tetratricopeptide repeat protein [bacterium]